jgi:xylose isomerase
MKTYLMLKERAKAYRNDPRVKAAEAESGIPDLTIPTLAEGESWKDIANESGDPLHLADKGYGYDYLDQLATEHLMGFNG